MRRILVTGANKGIGRAITTAILEGETDTSVVMGSRSLERGRAALASIVGDHPDWAPRLQVQQLDVSSDQSVLKAAAEIKASLWQVWRRTGDEPPFRGDTFCDVSAIQ